MQVRRLRVDVEEVAAHRRAGRLVLEEVGRKEQREREEKQADVALAVDVDVDLEGNELRFDGERITNVRAEAIYDGRRVRVAEVRMSADVGGALLAGSVDLEAGRAEIERLTVATPDVHARAAGPFVLRWDDRLIETSDLTVEVEGTRIASDLRVDTGGRWLEATRLLVEREEDRLELLEPLRVERRDEEIEIVLLRARWNDDAEVAVSGQVDTALTRARLTRLDARVDGRPIRMTQPLRLDTRGDQVAVRGLALAGTDDERLTLDADVDLDARRAVLSNVRIAAAGESLLGRAPMTLDWNDGGVRLSNLDATWRGGVITGKAAYDRAPQATLAFSGISLAGITDELRGTGNGTLALQGTQAALQIDVPDLCLTSPDGPAWCGPLSARLRHDADVGVRVEELRWQGPDETFQLLGTAHWPYAWVDGQRTRTAGSPALTLDVRGRRWPGSPQALDGPMSLTVRGNSERLELRGLVQDLVWRDATSPRDDVAVTVTVDATRVQGDVRVVGDETARVAGRFALDRGVDWQDPAAWQRLWREARIEGSITADMRNWSHVQALAPGLRTLEGRARLDVEARGRLQRPELRGRLDLKDFRFRVQGDLPTFADLNGTITWEDGRARIPGLTGTLGHAPFRLAGDADVPFDGQPSFDVRLTGDNLLLSRSRHLRLRSNVDLRLEGPLDALRLGGRARLTNALYSAPMSLEGGTGGDDKLQIFSIRDWPFNQMAFDVRIDSDERIRVKNNVLNARIGVDAVLRGTGRTPEPEGRVRFRDTVVKLPLSTLQGAQGELTFTKADPLRPMLRATARSRVKGYDLDVRAWGALPDIELSVYARPQVSPEEALLLLTTGTTREALRVEGITASSFQAIVQTFGGAAIAPLGSPADPDRPSFFDRFDVTVGRFTSREGRSTVEAEFQFGKRVYLRGERDRFDETNVGLVWRVRFR